VVGKNVVGRKVVGRKVTVGRNVRSSDALVGEFVGALVGKTVGDLVGETVGDLVGASVGSGATVGATGILVASSSSSSSSPLFLRFFLSLFFVLFLLGLVAFRDLLFLEFFFPLNARVSCSSSEAFTLDANKARARITDLYNMLRDFV